MPRIAIIATYFGNWPPWFPAFVRSCQANPGIDWLVFSDCPAVPALPANVKVIGMTMADLNRRASEATGLPIRKELYSQCDLRPAYGQIFAEELVGYDWWGHCDLDVVWGDLGSVLNEETLADADLFSSPQGPRSLRIRHSVAGHLTLWRNSERVNSLYRSFPGVEEKLSSASYFFLDEEDVSAFVRRPDCPVRMRWADRQVIDYHDLESEPYGWTWRDGKLRDSHGREWHYLHFMTWKRYLKRIDFRVGETPRSFVIQRRGIWSKPLPVGEVARNLVRIDRGLYVALVAKRKAESLLGGSWKTWALKRKRRAW